MARVRWSVYVLASQSRSRTYVGIALDVGARLRQHNGHTKGGAKSTRAGRPWIIAHVVGPFGTRGAAQRVEAAIKALPRGDRLRRSALARR